MKTISRIALLAILPLLAGCRPESAFRVSLRLEDETTGKPIADAWVITVAEVDYAPLREEPYNKAVAAARGITGTNGKLRLKKVEGTYFGEEPKNQLWLMLESRKPLVEREITAIRGGSIFIFSSDHGFLHQPFAVTETDPEYRGWYGGNETSWNRKTIKMDPEAVKTGQPLVLKWKVPDDPRLVKGAFQTEFLAFMMSGMTEKTGTTVKEKEALYNFFVRNMEEAARTTGDPFFQREYEKLKDPETKKEVLSWQFANTENHDTTLHEWLTQKALELLPAEYTETKQYAEAIKQGVIDEDDNVRAVHHFYNPDKPESGMLNKDNALKWGAIGCPGNPGNEWDLEDAVRYYRAGDKEKAYKALGHVIHLLEDLSAPMHTRMIVHDKMFHGEAARFETYFSELIKKQANSLPPEYWQTAEAKPAADIKRLFEDTAKMTFGSFTLEGQTVNFNDYYAPNKFIKNPDNQTLELMGKHLFPRTITAGAALMVRFHAALHPELSAQKPADTATDAGPAVEPDKDKTGYKVAESTETDKSDKTFNTGQDNTAKIEIEKITAVAKKIKASSKNSINGLGELERISPKTAAGVRAIAAIARENKSHMVKITVFEILTNISTGAVHLKGVFQELLDDPDETAQMTAIYMCKRFKIYSAAPKIRKLLKNRPRFTFSEDSNGGADELDISYAGEAARTLVELNDFESVDEMMSRDEIMSQGPGDYLADFGARILPKAVQAARERKGAQREGAVGIIYDMRDEQALPSLIELVKDSDYGIAASAAAAAAEIVIKTSSDVIKKDVEPALEAQLNNSEDVVRRAVYTGLIGIDPKKYSPVILGKLKGESGIIQMDVFGTLAAYKVTDAIPFLENFIKEDEIVHPNYTDLRSSAARAIYRMTGRKVPYKGIEKDMKFYKDPYERTR